MHAKTFTMIYPNDNPTPTQTALPARQSKLWAWMQLLRVPNLLTVPGEPIAGFLMAAWAGAAGRWGGLVLAATASVLLYAAGLLQNDLFDLSEDRRDRPGRPLPSGRVAPAWPIIVAVVLMLSALSLTAAIGQASLAVAACLVVAITAYNGFLKPVPVVGPLAMGLCRGLSVLLGASAAGAAGIASPPVIICAAGVTLYIAAVTQIARNETRARPVGVARFLPVLTLAAWLAAMVMAAAAQGLVRKWLSLGALVPSAVAIAFGFAVARSLKGSPQPERVQAAVGKLIRNLLVIEAAVAAASPMPGPALAVGLLALFPVSTRLGRWFYAS